MCGDRKSRVFLLCVTAFLSLEALALACPACAVSTPQRNFWQNFIILSVMGILPFVVAAIVYTFIKRIQKNEQSPNA